MKEVIINLHGVNVVCHGHYYKGLSGDRETPPEGASFDVEMIELNGVDITDLAFASVKQGTIERLALDAYNR
jgi:hypothetical protein